MQGKSSLYKNGECRAEQDIGALRDDVGELRNEQLNQGRELTEVKNAVEQISHHIIHLSVLPAIKDELHNLNTNTIGPATDRWRVPLPVFLLVTAAICLILVLREVGDRTVRANTSGLEIGAVK